MEVRKVTAVWLNLIGRRRFAPRAAAGSRARLRATTCRTARDEEGCHVLLTMLDLRWTVRVHRWLWTYTFTRGGAFSWLDPFNGKKGNGT